MLKDVHQWKEFLLRRFKPSIFDFPRWPSWAQACGTPSFWPTHPQEEGHRHRISWASSWKSTTSCATGASTRAHFMCHRPTTTAAANGKGVCAYDTMADWDVSSVSCLSSLFISGLHAPSIPILSRLPSLPSTSRANHANNANRANCASTTSCAGMGHLRWFPRSLNLRKMRKWRNMRQPVTMAMATVTNVRIGRNFMIRSREVLKCIQLSPRSIPPLLDLNLKWSHVWHHHGSCAPAIVAVLNRSKLEMTVTEKIASSGQMS